MSTATTMRQPRPERTHIRPESVHVSLAFRRDHALAAAGSAYQLTQVLSEMVDSEIARLFHEDRTTYNRKKNGQNPSAKSRTREQILRLGSGGGNPWPLVADDFAAAVQASIAGVATGELQAALDQADLSEQDSNGKVDQVQLLRSKRLRFCPTDARQAKLYQVACTLIMLAIHDELVTRRAL